MMNQNNSVTEVGLFPYDGAIYDVWLTITYGVHGAPDAYSVQKIVNYDTGEELDKDSSAFKALVDIAIPDHKKQTAETRAYAAEIWAREAREKRML
jgi:hypothetical protein